MDISETEVKVIVERILKQIQNNQEIVQQEPEVQQGNKGLFSSIESAIDAAEKAFYQLHQLTAHRICLQIVAGGKILHQ